MPQSVHVCVAQRRERIESMEFSERRCILHFFCLRFSPRTLIALCSAHGEMCSDANCTCPDPDCRMQTDDSAREACDLLFQFVA